MAKINFGRSGRQKKREISAEWWRIVETAEISHTQETNAINISDCKIACIIFNMTIAVRVKREKEKKKDGQKIKREMQQQRNRSTCSRIQMHRMASSFFVGAHR